MTTKIKVHGDGSETMFHYSQKFDLLNPNDRNQYNYLQKSAGYGIPYEMDDGDLTEVWVWDVDEDERQKDGVG